MYTVDDDKVVGEGFDHLINYWRIEGNYVTSVNNKKMTYNQSFCLSTESKIYDRHLLGQIDVTLG